MTTKQREFKRVQTYYHTGALLKKKISINQNCFNISICARAIWVKIQRKSTRHHSIIISDKMNEFLPFFAAFVIHIIINTKHSDQTFFGKAPEENMLI